MRRAMNSRFSLMTITMILSLALFVQTTYAEEASFVEEAFAVQRNSSEETFVEEVFSTEADEFSLKEQEMVTAPEDWLSNRSGLVLPGEEKKIAEVAAAGWKLAPELSVTIKGNTVTLKLTNCQKLPKDVKYFVYEVDELTGAAVQIGRSAKSTKLIMKNRAEGRHEYFARAERVNVRTGMEEYGRSSEHVTVSIQNSFLWQKAPVLSVRQENKEAIMVSWAVKEPAEKYLLTITRGKGKFARTERREVVDKFYLDTDAVIGVQNKYQVQPLKKNQSGKVSKAKTCTLSADAWKVAPLILSAEQCKGDKFLLTWKAAAPADSFIITGGNNTELIPSTQLKKYNYESSLYYSGLIQGKKLGGKNKFRIQPLNSDEMGKPIKGKKSAVFAVVTQKEDIGFGPASVNATVNVISGETDIVNIVISWESDNENAASFVVRLFNKDFDHKQTIVKEEGKTSYSATFSSVKNGLYGYHVRALDRKGNEIHDDLPVIKTVDTLTRRVESIWLTAETDELSVGKTLQIHASINSSNAEEPPLTWASSNEEVATVDPETGIVTALKPGDVIIRAYSEDGHGTDFSLRVVDMIIPQEVSISFGGDYEIEDEVIQAKVGDSIAFSAQIVPYGASGDVTWTVYPPEAAEIDSHAGNLLIKQACEEIRVCATTDNGISQEVTICAKSSVTGMTISGNNTVNVGESITLTAAVLPDNTVENNIIWTAKNTNADVLNGVVTGRSAGTVEIEASVATDQSIKATKTITVVQLPTKVEISGGVNIYTGKTSQLTATVTPTNAADRQVNWSSSNTAVATVATNGLVTAKAPGTAEITAKASGNTSVSAKITVTVINEWGDWSSWSTTKPTASDTVQVESRTEYRYRDQTAAAYYTDWSKWSYWKDSRESIPDSNLKQEQSAMTYGWYYYLCPNCKKHNQYHSSNCTGCGQTVPNNTSTWKEYVLDHDHSVTSFTETYYNIGLVFKWTDSTGQSMQKTRYRYRTRTYVPETWGNWSSWSTTSQTPSSTKQVETRTTWRYRLKNSFGNQTVSDWVLANTVPSGATIIATKWIYTETTTSTATSMSGWTRGQGSWKQTGSGTVRSANFSPAPGFDTTNALYKQLNVAAPVASETSTQKRTVSSSADGYLYWHWMYDCGGGKAYDRVIHYQKGTGYNGYNYKYFQAYESKTNFGETAANQGQTKPQYTWYYNGTDHQTNSESGGSWYWYRLAITKTSYTDYVMNYTYTRDVETSTQPTAGSTVSNIRQYVKYVK